MMHGPALFFYLFAAVTVASGVHGDRGRATPCTRCCS